MPDPVTAIIGGTIGSAASNIFGASAAKDDMNEAVANANAVSKEMLQKGLDTQKSYFDQGNALLTPFAQQGGDVYKSLVQQLPDLTAPINMTQEELEKTPGYQFNLQQGIRGVDLSSAAKGMSGAQAKAAAQYATQLANNTYLDQFNVANTNKTNAFNRLLQTAQLGSGAAQSAAGNATSAGNAALAGATSSGNTQSGNLVKGGQVAAGADTAIGANIGNAISGTAGLIANGGNVNKLLSMYGTG